MHAGFAGAEVWPALLAPVLLGVFLRWCALCRKRRLAELCTTNRIEPLCRELSPRRRVVREGLRLAAVLLGVVALLQPLHGEAKEQSAGSGVDIVIALDVSRSMLARDLVPSRLLRAQAGIRELVERVEGDRLGLVVFAGEAELLVPLTQDLETFAQLASSAGPLALPRGGSDLGAALERASSAFDAASGASAAQEDAGKLEVVLLLSDGEDLAGQGPTAAARARELEITVHCVGFGSEQGSKIAVPSDAGERFLRDASGSDVISALDEGVLRRVAEATRGEYVDAGRVPAPLVELYEQHILPEAERTIGAGEERAPGIRFQWPLCAAVCLLLLELAWSERRRS